MRLFLILVTECFSALKASESNVSMANIYFLTFENYYEKFGMRREKSEVFDDYLIYMFKVLHCNEIEEIEKDSQKIREVFANLKEKLGRRLEYSTNFLYDLNPNLIKEVIIAYIEENFHANHKILNNEKKINYEKALDINMTKNLYSENKFKFKEKNLYKNIGEDATVKKVDANFTKHSCLSMNSPIKKSKGTLLNPTLQPKEDIPPVKSPKKESTFLINCATVLGLINGP